MTAKRTKRDSAGFERIYSSREKLENVVHWNDSITRFLLENTMGYLRVRGRLSALSKSPT